MVDFINILILEIMKSDLGLYQRHGFSMLENPSEYSRVALLTAIILSLKERFLSYTILNGNSYKMKNLTKTIDMV